MSENKETVLAVEGMTCGSCVRHVSDALRAVEGVDHVEVRLRDGTVRVRHRAASSIDPLIEALREAGYDGAPAT